MSDAKKAVENLLQLAWGGSSPVTKENLRAIHTAWTADRERAERAEARVKVLEKEAKAIQVVWDRLQKGHNSIRTTQDWLIEFGEVIKPLILRNREKA